MAVKPSIDFGFRKVRVTSRYKVVNAIHDIHLLKFFVQFSFQEHKRHVGSLEEI